MAQIDTGRKGAASFELNIVPFIDVMSCLTAFLLVTAAWLQTAQLPNAPVGRGGGSAATARITVLVEPDAIHVAAIPADQTAPIDRRSVRAADWDQLEATLRELGSSGEHPRVEIAAEGTAAQPITYQSLIAAMDTTVRAGFPDVGVTDPALLAR